MEKAKKKRGKQSFVFERPIKIAAGACVGGKMESEGPLGTYLDASDETDKFGGENWEDSESRMMKQAVETAIKKAGVKGSEVEYIFCGDLLGKMIASSFGVKTLELPLLGVYGACSTMGESMLLAAAMIDGEFAECTVAATSSHFASAEKEFRFPLAYGSQRPPCTSWTVTGSGAVVLKAAEHAENGVFVTGATPGKIVDYGITDKMNMGACMSPAAAATIATHLNDFGVLPEHYDKIITGDLGEIGSEILIDLLKAKGYDITEQHMDCGLLIYDNQKQDVHSGGSGCGCAAVTLNGFILDRLRTGQWKRILFVPTGALLSTVSSNEGNTVPGIAHAVVLEKKVGETMDYILAFLVGGAICALVQILMDCTKLQPGRVMVLLVCGGAVLSAIGLYGPFKEWAGAGASVPLLGFGHTLYEGVQKAVDEEGFLGIFKGGFTASAVGVSAALIFGYLASLVFSPKAKEAGAK